MIEVQLEGYIYELNFGYNAKMEEYTNSNSDIPKLAAIAIRDKKGEENGTHK